MSSAPLKKFSLSHQDLNFLVETVSPGVSDKTGFKSIIQQDVDFRKKYVSDEKVFHTLHENFQKVKKPLNFIAENYLLYKRQMIFG